jgi:hypothetical protein
VDPDSDPDPDADPAISSLTLKTAKKKFKQKSFSHITIFA